MAIAAAGGVKRQTVVSLKKTIVVCGGDREGVGHCISRYCSCQGWMILV